MTTPQELVERALAASRSADCSVLVRQLSSANLRWANNTLTTNGVMSGCQVTVVAQQRTSEGTTAGVVSGPAVTVADVTALVKRADQVASESAAAEDAAPVADGIAATDWDEPPATTSISVFDGFAVELGDVLTAARAEDRLLYGFVEHSLDTTYLGTSTGLRLRHEQSAGNVGITGKPTDLSTSAWVGQASDDFTDVSAHGLSDELVRRIGWAERRIDVPAGRYETLLPPTAVADLLLYAYFVASGRDAFEGRTVFSAPGGGTKVGQQIARPGVRVSSDPAQPGLATLPFVAATGTDSTVSVFDNGLPVGAVDWISDGRLAALPTSRHTAELTGLPWHPYVDNLVLEIEGGAGSVDEMVTSTSGRGLLVTCLWYIRKVDSQELLLTGLTRDGTYVVEGGEVIGVANNFRFNESPIALLNRYAEAGATERSWSREWGDSFSRTATPALRIPDFNMSSVSPAS